MPTRNGANARDEHGLLSRHHRDRDDNDNPGGINSLYDINGLRYDTYYPQRNEMYNPGGILNPLTNPVHLQPRAHQPSPPRRRSDRLRGVGALEHPLVRPPRRTDPITRNTIGHEMKLEADNKFYDITTLVRIFNNAEREDTAPLSPFNRERFTAEDIRKIQEYIDRSRGRSRRKSKLGKKRRTKRRRGG